MIQENPKYDEYRERLNTFSQEFDAGLFIHLLKKSLLWVVLVIVLSLVAAKIYLYYTPQVYEAKATLQLQEADAANRILDVSPFNEESSLEAKVELIRSKLLIAECLKNFPLEVSYYTQGEILESENYVLSPYRIEILEKKSQQGIGKPIFINFKEREFDIELNGKTYSNLKVGEIIDLEWIAFRTIVVDPDHLDEIQNNDQFYFIINREAQLINRFTSGMNVRILNNTARTIQIAYKDENPIIARDFVDAISREFIHFDLAKRQRSDEKILNFIDNQIDTVFDRLKSSEIVLNSYKQENKISDLSTISKVYLDRLNDIETRMIQLDVEERILNEIENLTKGDIEEVGVFNLVPLVAGSKYEASLSKLMDNLHSLTLKKEEALYSVTVDNNLIEGLNYQIGIQKELIIKTIITLRDKVRESKSSLQVKLDEIENV